MRDFDRAASANDFSGVPTAREIANEYSNYANSLREAKANLESEISNIRRAKSGLAEELNAGIRHFVETTLTELNGAQFDTLAQIAQNTPDLGGESITFIRKKMTGAREQALAAANADTTYKVDAVSFQAALADATTKAETLGQQVRDANEAVITAQAAVTTLTESPRYEFLKLSKEISDKGQPALTVENRAYYEPKGFLKSMKDYYWNKSDEYQQVRDAMAEYGHGEDGKDLFADVDSVAGELSGLETDLTAKQQAAAELQPLYAAAVEIQRQLQELGRDIKTDGQILNHIQNKVVEDFGTPSFAHAVADRYGKDFPSELPLLADKMKMMDRLAEGAQAKLLPLEQALAKAASDARKYGNYKADKRFENWEPGRLNTIRTRNAARRREYDGYARATHHGLSRTHDYHVAPGTVYVRDDNTLLNWIIADQIIDGLHHDHGRSDQGYTPSTSDLLGMKHSRHGHHGTHQDNLLPDRDDPQPTVIGGDYRDNDMQPAGYQ